LTADMLAELAMAQRYLFIVPVVVSSSMLWKHSIFAMPFCFSDWCQREVGLH